jgi:quercetin dioxygenase-like cupin family protein
MMFVKKNMRKRIFENPMMRDKVTVLKAGEDTNGEYILVEVELKKGGGVPLHYHTSFTEEFTAVEGILGIGLKKKNLLLIPGEKAMADKNELHRFYNPGDETIRFLVKIAPAEERFLQSLGIGYGLATDGLTNKNGTPKKLDHLAFLLELSDTRFKGFLALITPFLLRRAKKVRQKGIGDELIRKYC